MRRTFTILGLVVVSACAAGGGGGNNNGGDGDDPKRDGGIDSPRPDGPPLPKFFTLELSTSRPGDEGFAMLSNLPAKNTDCLAMDNNAPCGDVDGDGLTDAWEDHLLERMHPVLRFDEDEPLTLSNQ